MNALLLVTLSFFGPASLDDGSLVFLENCNYFVERYTGAPIGHVAIAVNEENDTWIYEATPGHVRRLTWNDYRAELATLNSDRARKDRAPIITWVLEPAAPLTDQQTLAMRKYLASQLDRRYSVRGIVRGKTGDGIHCAELVAHALNATDRAEIDDCHKQSPMAILKLARGQSAVAYQPAIERPVVEEAWCSRTWRKCTHWAVMCRWSWGEAWRYCW